MALVLLAAGCGGAEDRPAPRAPEPAGLSPRVDNPYWPMAPGSRWVYRDGRQRIVVTVLRRTRNVAGAQARVVHDVVTENGALVEDTYDWYAQDGRGNVWYLGEDTREYENGRVVSTEGSWAAGVDGARAGIIMPARPRVGMRYRQEHYAGHAEDKAEILYLNERVEVPAGRFKRALMTRDWTPLEPNVVEHKVYARGVGPVLALGISGGAAREELVRFER